MNQTGDNLYLFEGSEDDGKGGWKGRFLNGCPKEELEEILNNDYTSMIIDNTMSDTKIKHLKEDLPEITFGNIEQKEDGKRYQYITETDWTTGKQQTTSYEIK